MEGFLLNEQTWLQHLKEKRWAYGLSQNRLAVATGITRQYLSDIETGKVKPSEDLQQSLWEALERFNPDAPLEMLFDYVRIRFPTTDVQQVVENILQLKLSYFLHEDYGFYSYSEHYALGDIFVLCSHELDKGVLVELKGRGCRQFESYLLAQQRSWYEFFMDVLVAGGVMKRLDLAINDKTGILNIPVLTEKCQQEECISVFRSFKSYRSGELVRKDIPVSSSVRGFQIWTVEPTGDNEFNVTYSVDQLITEGENTKTVHSAYIVSVYVDGSGNMVLVKNPTITNIPKKSSYKPKAIESEGTVDSITTNEINEFLTTFFKLYPTATASELSYYVNDGILKPIGKEYIFQELVNPIHNRKDNQVTVSLTVEYIDQQTKATQVSQFDLVLEKNGSNWKIIE